MSRSGALVGMDRWTGAPITGIAHLKQSLGDILGTRKERDGNCPSTGRTSR